MRIGYFGSPEISARLLSALCDSTHEVAFVVSNPDRPRGRSGKLVPSEVAMFAEERRLPLFRFERLKQERAWESLAPFEVDLNVVFAYGKLLPAEIYDQPKRGSINLHASLLPVLRGASPIQSALLQGFKHTGWSVQYVAERMDAGDIIGGCDVSIDLNDTTASLTKKMLPEGITLMLEVLNRFDEVAPLARKQNEEEATYCSKIHPDMAWIDWESPVLRIHDLVRAFVPWPIARSEFAEAVLRLHETRPALDVARPPEARPGDLVAKRGKPPRLFVTCADGLLEILSLQPENRKQLTAAQFLNGYQKNLLWMD